MRTLLIIPPRPSGEREMDCIAPASFAHTPNPSPPEYRGRGVGGEGDGLHCACKFYTHAQPLTPDPSPWSTGARGEDRLLSLLEPNQNAHIGFQKEARLFRRNLRFVNGDAHGNRSLGTIRIRHDARDATVVAVGVLRL